MNAFHFPYAILAGIIPSLIWLFFWNREDHEQPEPRSLLVACFIGGMVAVLLAIPTEQFIATLTKTAEWKYSLWAVAEEVLKFIVVAVVALRSRYYDEPIDAMIYCITVALGFAALENTLFIFGAIANNNLIAGLSTGNMRFIGATLVHVVSSTLIGFALGLAFYKNVFVKVIYFLIGIAGAIAIHAGFNLSIIQASASETLKAFGWIWGAVVIMIVLFEEVKAVKPRLVEEGR